nr:uncharacterized protein LOC105709107 [Aotus nancymaae]
MAGQAWESHRPPPAGTASCVTLDVDKTSEPRLCLLQPEDNGLEGAPVTRGPIWPVCRPSAQDRQAGCPGNRDAPACETRVTQIWRPLATASFPPNTFPAFSSLRGPSYPGSLSISLRKPGPA